MARQFRLLMVTQEGVRFDGQVESVLLPGELGYFGVRAEHAAMISALQVGVITVKQDGKPSLYACGGGLAKVTGTEVVVLADSVEAAAIIDSDRARQAEERARERLYAMRDADVDVLRAELAMKRAMNRLRARDRSAGM
jgi:F-type H+-transporting ATPase subunit epsilon